MNTFFGGIHQNGYVVSDLDAAIGYWTTVVGVGPFYRLDHAPLDYFSYQGEPSTPDLDIALANSGDLQIELIQQLNDAPSPWRSFALAKGGPAPCVRLDADVRLRPQEARRVGFRSNV